MMGQPIMKFSKKLTFILSFLLIFILLDHPVDAKVYKWKDENGKTHYTDSPNKIPFKFRPKNRKEFRITNCHKPISKDIKVLLEKLGNNIAESKVNLKRDYKTLSKMRNTSLVYYKFSQSTLEFELALKKNEIKFNKLIQKYECSTERYIN